MKKFRMIAVAAVIASLFTAPAFAWNWPWAASNEGKISMTGSTTVLPLAQKAAEEYMKANKDVDISVSGGGSGVGIAALIDGTCSIGNSSRSIKNKEIVKAKSKGVNPVGTIVANDGIAIVVNSANKVEDLTLDQLKAIFSGDITKWSQVGGNGEKIVCISRDSASGTFEVFNELVLRGAKLRTDSLMLASNKEIAEAVAKTPGAIGYVGLAYLSSDLNSVKVNGVAANEANVLNGSYKISRPLFMYTNGDPSGKVKDFIDYILSPEGQRIVKEVGYVTVK
ncbi:MAG: phosphate ABC transporter substrate-binding protein [Spirochaetia bacterium]|nr:phosphate ABC transporter substrate-binding protein [Spirochaetia bacterium]